MRSFAFARPARGRGRDCPGRVAVSRGSGPREPGAPAAPNGPHDLPAPHDHHPAKSPRIAPPDPKYVKSPRLLPPPPDPPE